MKILTRKKQDEILKRICANEIIAKTYMGIDNIEAWTRAMENNCEISYLVDGINGICKVRNTVYGKFDNKKEQKNGQ